jgi:hypothetical protein
MGVIASGAPRTTGAAAPRTYQETTTPGASAPGVVVFSVPARGAPTSIARGSRMPWGRWSVPRARMAVMHVVVGTADGLRAFGVDGTPGERRFDGRVVTALGPQYPHLWAIVDGAEVWRTEPDGRWSLRASSDGPRLTCIADVRAGYVVGTSEAHLRRVTGAGLDAIDAFEHVAGRDGWYTPWGGPPDVRSISEDRRAVYVNVHVGGIARSRDEGASWEPTIDVDADIHRVWAEDGRVFGACARGLAVSADDGDTWEMRAEGLHATYCRGVARCGDAVLVSASMGPSGRRSAVYRGSADGGPFERCRSGLPEWFEANIDSLCLDAAPDRGVAAFGTGDGRIFLSDDEGSSWSQVASGLSGITCVTLLP